MPTVLRKDGFRIVIYLDDHLPAHVHAISASSEVKIDLGNAEDLPKELFNSGVGAAKQPRR